MMKEYIENYCCCIQIYISEVYIHVSLSIVFNISWKSCSLEGLVGYFHAEVAFGDVGVLLICQVGGYHLLPSSTSSVSWVQCCFYTLLESLLAEVRFIGGV